MIPRVAVSVILILVFIVPVIAIPLIPWVAVSIILLFTGNHYPQVALFILSQDEFFELSPV